MPCGAPIVRVPASPVPGPKVVTARFVPVALVKVIAARPLIPETDRLVEVTLEIVVRPRLVRPVALKFVVVTPLPTIVRPPIMVVETLVPPIWIPPVVPPVPIETVVVPEPVAIFTVLDVPMPIATVWATLELPRVI